MQRVDERENDGGIVMRLARQAVYSITQHRHHRCSFIGCQCGTGEGVVTTRGADGRVARRGVGLRTTGSDVV